MKSCLVIGLRNLIIENKASPHIQAAWEILLGRSAGAPVGAPLTLVNEPGPLNSSLAAAVRKYPLF